MGRARGVGYVYKSRNLEKNNLVFKNSSRASLTKAWWLGLAKLWLLVAEAIVACDKLIQRPQESPVVHIRETWYLALWGWRWGGGLECHKDLFRRLMANVMFFLGGPLPLALLLRDWYEITALYNVELLSTYFLTSRQYKRVLYKSKTIRIFLIKWGMLEALVTSRNL